MSSSITPVPVGRTAMLTAAVRAVESRRPDRLLTDPWAEVLVEAHLRASPPGEGLDLATVPPAGSSELWDFLRAYFPGRTPFLDDQVRDGIAAGAGQVVSLAAGMDARAARLDLPADVPVYELDSEPVLDFKARVLAEAGVDVARRIPVPVDLAADWSTALRAAGFRADVPTVWIAEGLLFYLDAAACDRLAGSVRELAAPGGRIAVEYFNRLPTSADMPFLTEADARSLDAVLSLIEAGPSAPPQTWLERFGVTVDRLTDVATEVANQGREVPRILDPSRDRPFRILLAAGRLD